MHSIDIHEAKTHLSRLVDQAAKGEAFVIAKSGKPLVKVVPLRDSDIGTAIRVGFMGGETLVPEDFDRWGEKEIERLFLQDEG